MAKKQKSIKLTPGKQAQITSALDLLQETYVDVLGSEWTNLIAVQKTAILNNSPLLDRFIRMGKIFNG